MILYAIREKSTGYYLPQAKSGFTRTSPEKDCIPRLHKDKATANRCLAVWLQGRFTLDYDYDNDKEMMVEKDENRKKENMEVVSIKLMRGINTYWDEL